MVLSIGLEGAFDEINGVSWLPLYHDMGLMMIGFPILYGGHLTFMSPMALVRRPLRWIQVLSNESQTCHIVSPAPNFAFDLVAQRGMPTNNSIDLNNVVLINGSEPVNLDSILKFTEAFLPYGLTKTAVRPSYGMAEAALFVSSIRPYTEPTAVYLDREKLGLGRAVHVEPDAPNALAPGVVRRGRGESVGGDRRPRHSCRAARRARRRDLVARRQHRSRLLGAAGGDRVHVRQQAAVPAGFRRPRRGRQSRCDVAARRQPGAATSATCTSPAGSRTW